MAVPRVTVDRISVRKLETQMNKDKYAHVKAAMARVPRTSNSPGVGTVYWDPPKEALEGMIQILVAEQGFSKKVGGATWQKAEESIERLRSYLREHFESTSSATPAANN